MRALAVVSVLACHWLATMSPWFGLQPEPRLLMSGDFGVSLFFALSGFLIGRILIRTASTSPTPRALLVFLTRRWMRTLPLYFA